MTSHHILITGGSGFIGSNLALKLVEKGNKVTVLDNMSKQIHGSDYHESQLYKNIKGKVTFVLGSVENKHDLKKAMADCDVIVHLAAETGTGQSMYEVSHYIDVNIRGTANLLDILANEQHHVKKLVVASSRAIYGEGEYLCHEHGIVFPKERSEEQMSRHDFEIKCPICNKNAELKATTEEAKKHPSSVYGFTKQAQEEMCLLVGKSINLPVVAFRYQNVYGPGQSLKNPYTGILAIFSTRIQNGKDIKIFEDGQESRDFVYIDDVVSATILGIEKDEANFQSFNVGSGVAISVEKVAKTLKEKFGSQINIEVTGNYRLGDIRHNYADLTKIKRLLGFVPQISFENGIGNFVKWVETQEIEKDNYDKSIEEMKQRGLYK